VAKASAAATGPDRTMGLVHGKWGALWEEDCDKNSLNTWGIDTTTGPPTPTGGHLQGGWGDMPIRDTIRRVQVLKAARGRRAGDGEGWTSAASAQQTRDARSVSRRDRPWGVSDGGREGSGVGHYALRALEERWSGPARACSAMLLHGTRWAMAGVVRAGMAWVWS
jgi:hypothetical protein